MTYLLTFVEAFGISLIYTILPVSLVVLLEWHPALVFIGWGILTGVACLVWQGLTAEEPNPLYGRDWLDGGEDE